MEGGVVEVFCVAVVVFDAATEESVDVVDDVRGGVVAKSVG